MARTNIVANANVPSAPALLSSYPNLQPVADSLTPTFTSTSDPTDRSTLIVDGKTLLAVYNSDTIAHTVTVTSVADASNRAGNITAYSVKPASAAVPVALIGPFKSAGWAQPSPNTGQLFIDVSDAKLQLSVLTLP